MPIPLSSDSIYIAIHLDVQQSIFHDFDNSVKASDILSDLNDDPEHMARLMGLRNLFLPESWEHECFAINNSLGAAVHGSGLYAPDSTRMVAESDVKYLLLRKEAEEDLL
jgi:hypothetical protein